MKPKPKAKPKTGKIAFDYTKHMTHHPINTNKGVYIREHFDTRQIKTEKVDSRTTIIHRVNK